MADPLTTIGIALGGALASKDTLNKLLGPTAAYLGEGARDLVEMEVRNVGKIFEAACRKLGRALDSPGQVNPRVLKGVWDDGRFVEDEFAAEYFGGLLASARSKDGKDDSALPFLALVRSLSSHQLRLHFIVYYLLAEYARDHAKLAWADLLEALRLFVPAGQLVEAMDLETGEAAGQLVAAVHGLIDNGLIQERYQLHLYDVRRVRGHGSMTDEGVAVYPNEPGACLFLRSLGFKGVFPEAMALADPSSALSEGIKRSIKIPRGAECSFSPEPEESDDKDDLREEIEDQGSTLESELEDLKSEFENQGSTFESDLAELKKEFEWQVAEIRRELKKREDGPRPNEA